MNARTNFFWSLRRELWESRWLYFVPFAASGLVLFAYFVAAKGVRNLPETFRKLASLDPVKQAHTVALPYDMAASVILFTGFLVGMFYCLDALNGERRDRSILFWKSMPVSDTTTVLAKTAIPLAVVPLLAFAVALATQAAMFVASTVVLAASGHEAAALGSRLPFARMTLIMLYGLAVHALWFAPIYGWLLVVSAWAKRAVLLWSVLPFFAAGILEWLLFDTRYVAALVRYRFAGAMHEAFAADALKGHINDLSQLDPARFLASPGLWLGLAFAAACILVAIRVRRYREPI